MTAAVLTKPSTEEQVIDPAEAFAGLRLIADWLGKPDAPEAMERAEAIRREIGQRHLVKAKAALERAASIVRERPGTTASDVQLTELERLNRRIAKALRPEDRAKLATQRADLLSTIERRRERGDEQRRRVELASLEQLRGGEVMVEETVVDVPVLREGVPVLKNGKAETRQETVVKIRVKSRDGLETLATAHLHSNGDRRMMPDKKTPMPAVFNANQLAALDRYRALYLERREVSLRAVDATGAGEDRMPFDVQRSMMLERMVSSAIREHRNEQAGRSITRAEAYVSRIAGRTSLTVLRAVAGEGHTISSIAPGRRKAIRYTKALIAAADVLADRFGLT